MEEAIATFDAFPKAAEDAVVTSNSGGAATIMTALLIIFLVANEFIYYRAIDIKYEFKVDTEVRQKMKLDMDITLKMKCEHLGADYVDVAGNSTDVASMFLKMDPAHWSLAPNQIAWHKKIQAIKLAEGARSLDSLERFLHGSAREAMPEAVPAFEGDTDSCRMHGVIDINKVQANLHVAAGKSIHHARGHSHMIGVVPADATNFSHRIDRLAFTDTNTGASTLDGDVQITLESAQMFQYFIKVVPTYTRNLKQREAVVTNQYSVQEQHRKLDMFGLSATGVPGVYFKFELEALAVHVHEERRSISQFVVRLCGIVGGIFATTGMLHQTASNFAASLSTSASETNLPRSSSTSSASP